MIEPAHLLGTGGAIGAVLRYAVGQWVSHERFPFATLTVNVVGSFVLGIVTFSGLDGNLMLFVGLGACGSFTTYSSFSIETVQLWDSGDQFRATLYAVGSLALCLLVMGLAAGLVLLTSG